MTATSDLNRVQFIAEDFQTYRDEADAFFAANYPDAFNNLLNTDLGNALMDQLAFAMQSLAFMVNRRASELFLSTARLNKSITKLARMLGYPIAPAAPGTTDMSIFLTGAPYAFPITFARGFAFQGPGDTVYEFRNDTPVIFPAGSVSGIIPVREGQTKTLTFISSGLQNQEFQIAGIPDGTTLYSDGLILTVDGEEWARVPLLTYTATNIFEILFTEDPPKLRFGDGIAGNIPPEGAQVVLKYVAGKGLQGSVGSNQFSGPLTQMVVSGQTIAMTLSNPVGNVGADPEDIRHVKSFASSFFRTQSAAVIKSDYDTIAQLQPGVAIADAQIMRGVSGDITIQGFFEDILQGVDDFEAAQDLMLSASVSGSELLSVSGTDGLIIGGQNLLTVTGIGLLGVSGINKLGVSGSTVTGTSFLGVSGTNTLGVNNVAALFISGIPGLGVMGISNLGITNFGDIQSLLTAASGLFSSSVSGLMDYLSRVFSDTSKANNVQVVVLSVDANNKYIAPSQSTLDGVEVALQTIADAVVTVTSVDGSEKIVPTDIIIEIGISPTAVENDVVQQITNAMIQTTAPLGIMVRRKVGLNLFLSDINDAVRANTSSSDVIYINAIITNPTALLDADGNLLINKQQVIQNNNFKVQVVKRFTRAEVF